MSELNREQGLGAQSLGQGVCRSFSHWLFESLRVFHAGNLFSNL